MRTQSVVDVNVPGDCLQHRIEGSEALGIDDFALEVAKERLDDRIVSRDMRTRKRHHRLMLAQAVEEPSRNVGRAAIRMKDETGVRLALREGLLEGRLDEPSAVAAAGFPSHDLAGEDVDDDAKIELRMQKGDFGDVADPEFVRRILGEASRLVAQFGFVAGAGGLVVLAGGVAVAGDAHFLHDGGNGSGIDSCSAKLHDGGDFFGTVGSMTFLVDGADHRFQ